jgi:hypothetical protein
MRRPVLGIWVIADVVVFDYLLVGGRVIGQGLDELVEDRTSSHSRVSSTQSLAPRPAACRCCVFRIIKPRRSVC